MFDRFTDDARRVLVRAAELARKLGHDSISPELYVTAMIRDGVVDHERNPGCDVLRDRLDQMQLLELANLPRTLGPARQVRIEKLAPALKEGFRWALFESSLLKHDYVNCAHIVLGILHEGQCPAAKALYQARISLDIGRNAVRTRELAAL